MKIPKHVNTAWDWVEDHVRVLAVILTLAVAGLAWLWIPLLAAFVVGAVLGAFAVRSRMTGRVTRLRAEVDDLLRENGALRHQKTVLASGVLSSQTLLTQRLPMIREDPGTE